MRQVTLTNHTSDVLLCHNRAADRHEHHVLLPSQSSTRNLHHASSELMLSVGLQSVEKEWSIAPNGFAVRLPMSLAASWKVVKVADDCPWRVYCSKISRTHFRLSVFSRRDMSSFLSEIPDSVPLSSLLLPGTHDTMAFYGWPISQCQSLNTPLDVQLQSGIRVLDVRLAVVDGRLISYHGVYPQRTPFMDILATIHAFLTGRSTCSEALVMSIKQEDFATVSSVVFSSLVHEEMLAAPGGRDMWFLENRVPTLGEVRGRVVLFSRFGGDGAGWEGGLEGLGIHPTTWPDSARAGFTWQCKDTLVRTHDWYDIPSFLAIPEKTALATEVLLFPRKTEIPVFPTLAISYFSASSFPLAFPPTVARGFGWPAVGLGVEGVNSRLGKWLLDTLGGYGGASEKDGDEDEDEARIRGWALLDFYADLNNGLVPLLVECNFKGRKQGEEGWYRLRYSGW